MNPFVKWGLVGFVFLAVLGALLGDNEQEPAEPPRAEAAATGTPEPEPTESPTPEPTPDPEVSVTFSGPSNARRDNVVLKGTVDPPNAHVRIRGKSVKVRRGKWKLPVTLSKRGDNRFRVVATRKGFEKGITTVIVTRRLSAAERAAIRERNAQRRANRRALEAAESYLEFSGFSKRGLFEQLSSEHGSGFTEAEAQYAVDHVKVNWKQEAVEAARSYLDTFPMSRQELLDQLTSEYGGAFTYEEALYAVNKVY